MITVSGGGNRSSVFLDTSGLMALIGNDDQWHQLAEEQWNALITSGRKLITTSLVLIELADGLSHLRHRASAIHMRETLLKWRRAEVVSVTRRHEEAAWQLFADRKDKDWGMTDCVSMTIMWQKRIADVYSLDRHFLQAGFRLLLRS